MNYYQFNAEDFASDDYFKEWVTSPDKASELFWIGFLKEYPEKYYILMEARELVTGLQQIHQGHDRTGQLEGIWSRIETSVSRRRVPRKQWWAKVRWGAAAALVLLPAIGWVWTALSPGNADGDFLTEVRQAGEWKVVANDADQVMEIQLTDNSRVFLEKNSSIRYATGFPGPLREIFLTGEALFEVHKNPAKPFLVYANGLVTRVLGTSFAVKAANDDPNVTVTVITGRVSVYPGGSDRSADPEIKGLVLTPNQKAVFQRQKETLSKTLVEKPAMLPVPDNLPPPSFEFEEASAAEVFKMLEKIYGIEVLYDEELMKGCFLTVNLSKEDLFQKLKVICRVLEAEYELIDARVIIYSRGCHN